jgi:hypothetical protein
MNLDLITNQEDKQVEVKSEIRQQNQKRMLENHTEIMARGFMEKLKSTHNSPYISLLLFV